MNRSKILRPSDAANLLGISRGTLYRLIKSDASFPTRIHISMRCVGWRLADLEQWIASRGP